MAVNPDWRNVHTSLETGKRAKVRKCTRCKEAAVLPRARLCGPCQADRYDERVKAARGRAKRVKATKLIKEQDAASAASIASYLELIGIKP